MITDQCLQFQFNHYAKFLTHAKIKYTELQLVNSLIYMKKFTNFYQVLKEMHMKNLVPFFASRCISDSVVNLQYNSYYKSHHTQHLSYDHWSLTNYELLHRLVETPSRDIRHDRMMNRRPVQYSKQLNRHVTAMLNCDVTNTLVYVPDHSVNSQESHWKIFCISQKTQFLLRRTGPIAPTEDSPYC